MSDFKTIHRTIIVNQPVAVQPSADCEMRASDRVDGCNGDTTRRLTSSRRGDGSCDDFKIGSGRRRVCGRIDEDQFEERPTLTDAAPSTTTRLCQHGRE